jgi:hypothetical protein
MQGEALGGAPLYIFQETVRRLLMDHTCPDGEPSAVLFLHRHYKSRLILFSGGNRLSMHLRTETKQTGRRVQLASELTSR